MGKVEDCVADKLSASLSPGEEPTEQELAIKFSECREDHPGGDAGFGDSNESYYANAKSAGERSFNSTPDRFANFKKQGEQNQDIGSKISQSMHEAQFGKSDADIDAVESMYAESKYYAQEDKSTVIGMAFNYYDKIFQDDDVRKGNSFSNDTAQEMMKASQVIVENFGSYKNITKEFVALELSRMGFEPRQAYEFVDKVLSLELSKFPDVSDIPTMDGMTVPNENAETDFKPDDTMMGDVPRQSLQVDNITQDSKVNLGTKVSPKDPNEVTDSGAQNIRDKDAKRSGNQDGFNQFPDSTSREFLKQGERVHHVANSVMSNSPETFKNSLVQEVGPCDAGKIENPVTGDCEDVTIGKAEDPMPNPLSAIPKGEENVLPDWVKKVQEVSGCGCKNTFEKAVQTLQG